MPNLPDAEVRGDASTILPEVDVVVWQEIAEAADDAAIDAVFSLAEWTHLFYELEVPISVRKSKFVLTPTAQLPAGLLSFGMNKLSSGRTGVSPSRYLSWGIFSSVESPQLPPVCFAGSHWVSGAFTNAGQLGDADGWRMATWNQNFTATQAQIQKLNAAGITVVFGGDLNARAADMSKFTPSQTWVVNDSGFDKIAVCPSPGGVVVTSLSVERHALNSDHDLRVMNARLSV